MENRNGRGIFLGVVSVATLIVAIIGATFAYFSASVSTNYNNAITGGTLDNLSSAFSLTVDRVPLGTAVSGDALVPTDISESVKTDIEAALKAHCVDDGYTGCHLYKITANSSTSVEHVNIYLDSLTVTLTESENNTKSDWKYSIFTSEASSMANFGQSDTVTLVTNGNGQLDYSPAANAKFDMHNNAGLTADTPAIYYLMVFLKDDDPSHSGSTAQNSGDTNDATGTYNGSVSMSVAGGGKITATFVSGA